MHCDSYHNAITEQHLAWCIRSLRRKPSIPRAFADTRCQPDRHLIDQRRYRRLRISQSGSNLASESNPPKRVAALPRLW